MPLLILIYSIIGQLICKYEPFWQEVSVKSVILRLPLRPFGPLVAFVKRTLSKHLYIHLHAWWHISAPYIMHAKCVFIMSTCSIIKLMSGIHKLHDNIFINKQSRYCLKREKCRFKNISILHKYYGIQIV